MKKMILVLGILAMGTPALAAPIVYQGYDVGSTSLATSPNAVAAATAFNAAAGALNLITFEVALPAGVSLSAPNITNNSGCVANLCGYNTTVAGSMFQLQPGGTQTFTFTTPIDSFGAYFTGWQIGTQTITYASGGSVTLNMPAANIDQGGTVFFGFIDAGASILSVTYNAQNDIVAVDDLRYGRSSAAAVPEPASIVLLGSGLLAGARRWRRNRQGRQS